MGGRYFILGSQIGTMKAFLQYGKTREVIDLLKDIEDKQYIGSSPEVKGWLKKNTLKD